MERVPFYTFITSTTSRQYLRSKASSMLTITADGAQSIISGAHIYCPINKPSPSCIIKLRTDSSPHWDLSFIGAQHSILVIFPTLNSNVTPSPNGHCYSHRILDGQTESGAP
eukprot:766068_1